MTEIDLKDAQLAFREAEIAATVKLFAQLNEGDAPVVNLKPDSPREALPGFKNRLDMAAVTVAGHSYGATGVLQVPAPTSRWRLVSTYASVCCQYNYE